MPRGLHIAETEVRFRRADGGEALLGIVAAPFGDAAGKALGTRGIGRDHTLRHERDAALARAELRERLFTHLVRAIRDEIEPEATLAAAVRATGLALGAAGGVVLRRRGDALMDAASWGDPVDPALLERGKTGLDCGDDVAMAELGWQLIGHAARYRQAVEGAILLWRRDEDGGFPESDRALLGDVADQFGVAIAQVAQHEHMRSLSRTDPLTGLLNRRAFFEELERRLQRIERGTRGGVLLFIDMDNFKLVNDRRGHRAGDEAILALCRILASQSRGGDLLGAAGRRRVRLVDRGARRRGAAEVRAAALLAAATTLAAFSGDAEHPLGISLGVALVEPGGGESPEQLVAAPSGDVSRQEGGQGRRGGGAAGGAGAGMMELLQRVFRASGKAIDYETQKTLAASRQPADRRRLAESTSARPEVLYYLAADADAAARQAVAGNEATPVQADLLLARDRAPRCASIWRRRSRAWRRARPARGMSGCAR